MKNLTWADMYHVVIPKLEHKLGQTIDVVTDESDPLLDYISIEGNEYPEGMACYNCGFWVPTDLRQKLEIESHIECALCAFINSIKDIIIFERKRYGDGNVTVRVGTDTKQNPIQEDSL